MLALAILLLIAWVAGFSLHLLGGFIHIALVLAIIFGIAHMMRGRRATV